MTDAKKRSERRQRGEIETLPSGALRVKVYAGVDPLSGKRHYLRETIPAGPKAETEAEKVLVKFVNQVNESRNPRTRATVSQLLDRYMEYIDVDVTTRTRYEIAIRKHIKPLLGNLAIAKLNGETFDSFYKTLRTCRDHCGGRPFVDHRVKASTSARTSVEPTSATRSPPRRSGKSTRA